MSPRRQRMAAVALIVAGVGAAIALALQAFEENLLYFYSPSEVAEGAVPDGRSFRVGGLVIDGSVQRAPGELEVQFVLTDTATTIPVRYAGILPDLFREGQGIIAHGALGGDGVFIADEVLAKHDENYMPPEVAEALRQQHAGRDGASGD